MIELVRQIFRFGATGIFITILDFIFVYVLGTWTDIPVLYITFISYMLLSLINYVLNVKWVFITDNNHKRNIIIFFIIGIVALGITQLVMWIGTEIFHVYFMVVKCVSTVIVNVFNFVSRKLFLEKRSRAEGT